jgi:hypothetical protein
MYSRGMAKPDGKMRPNRRGAGVDAENDTFHRTDKPFPHFEIRGQGDDWHDRPATL